MDFTGKPYFNGDPELAAIRIKPVPPPTGGNAPIEMIARLPNEDCGCPEEVWRVDGMIMLFHFEDDGSSHAIIYAGDWEEEIAIDARSLDDLRAKAFQWIADLTDTPE